MKKRVLTLLSLCLSCLPGIAIPGIASAAEATAAEVTKEDVLALEWLDLIPQDERKMFDQMGMPQAQSHDGDAAAQSVIGSVRQELNGSLVKIPGFVIPLEGDENVVTEFMLVPYLGACIHVPPPPPNQLIYVRFAGGAPIQELWDVVYIIGTLKTETVSHELAEVGYVIEGIELEEYDDL